MVAARRTLPTIEHGDSSEVVEEQRRSGAVYPGVAHLSSVKGDVNDTAYKNILDCYMLLSFCGCS